MTREQIAVYLFTMAWMESEPVTVFEFELKRNTDKRYEFAEWLKDEAKNRFGGYHVHSYIHKSGFSGIDWVNYDRYGYKWSDLDMDKITVYGGNWSDKEHLEWLENELKKKKVEYSKIERR